MKQGVVYIVAALVVILWGTTFVSSKILLLNGLLPGEIFFLRFLMAYIVLLALNHRKWFSYSWRDELIMLGLGITGGSAYFLTENMALLYTFASNVSILVSSTPLLTAILVGAFYRTERPTLRQGIGSLVAFAGVALVVLNGQLILHLSPLGDMLALTASLTWAFYSLLMNMVKHRYSAEFITRKVFFYGLLTIIPYLIIYEPEAGGLQRFASVTVVSNLLYLGFVASVGGYLAWNWVLSRLSTVRATNYIYCQPVVTMLFSSVILHERITWMAILGTLVLIFGMAMMEKHT